MDKKTVEDNVNKLFSSSNNESIVEGLSFAQQMKTKYSFQSIQNKFVSAIMTQIVSWILSCFNKYSEKQFHDKMKGEFNYRDGFTGAVYPMRGFDFIDDWHKNHKSTFDKIIPVMQKLKTPINKTELHGLTLATIRKNGWHIEPHESECFRYTINRLYNILYYKVDSLQDITSR